MKKQLLNESEIRKMMKFANIGALSDPFVDKLNETAMYDEELMEEEGDELDNEPSAEGPPAEPELAVDPAADEEADLEAGPELEDEGGTTVEAGLEGLNAFLEAAMEHPEEIREKVQVEMADDVDAAGPEADDSLGLDVPEAPDAMDPEGAPDADADPMAAADDDLENELEEADLQLQEDDEFVNEVVRRVAKRLLKK